jgi:hypothetical protein
MLYGICTMGTKFPEFFYSHRRCSPPSLRLPSLRLRFAKRHLAIRCTSHRHFFLYFFLADTGLSLAHFLEIQCPSLFTMKFTRTLTDFFPQNMQRELWGYWCGFNKDTISILISINFFCAARAQGLLVRV